MLERPLPDGKALVRKFFQMNVSELDKRTAYKYGYESAYPILIVTDVQPNGMAAGVGLRPGDLILSIGGVAVRNTRELSIVMEKVNENDIVDMTIIRFTQSYFGPVQRQYNVRLRAKARRASPI
jgi:S1-C subfamily serine protease